MRWTCSSATASSRGGPASAPSWPAPASATTTSPGWAGRRGAPPLGIAVRARVFVLERLRLVDDEPVSFQASYLPAVLGVEVSKADLAVTPLRQGLAFQLGTRVT